MNADRAAPVEDCELCVVGAGIAGLNALFVASEYLTRADRVVLVDARPAIGGMWNDTYPYVRLHQPHPMFTAGSVAWAGGRPPAWLATRAEVLEHFARCLAVIRARVTLIERYGYVYRDHAEHDGAVITECDALAPDGGTLTLRSPRLIKAFGFRVPTVAPLALSSGRVRSLSPHSAALFGAEMDAGREPIVVVGGGKTGMDTAHAAITRYPGRAVDLVVGRGTIFLNRNRFFPRGARRWFGGTTSLELALDIAPMFDGDNEAALLEHFRRDYAVKLGEDFSQYVFGVMSEEENACVARGARAIVRDYLADVTERDGRPCLELRGGERRALEPGAWVVNCTGYVMRARSPYEPYVSPSGRVLSVQPTSSMHILTTFGAYFLSHLFFLGLIREVPLYELDHEALLAADKAVFPFASYTHILYNMMLISEVVPSQVITACALDFDRWYPLPRRLPALIRFRRDKAANLARCRAALDRVRERFGLHCGVLAHSGA